MDDRRRRFAELHSIFERDLHEHRRALIGWGTGLVAYAAVMLASFTAVRDNHEIAKLLESYPKAFREMFGVTDYTSGPGYLRAEIFSLVGPLLIIILAVLWGSDVTAGEEERGTLDVLMANPVSRRRVVAEKWAAVAVGVTLVTAVFGLVIGLGAPLVDMRVPTADLVAVLVSTALIAIFFATVALAVAAATGRRAVARGVAATLAVASYLASSLAELVGWLRPVRPFSPWYHALGIDPLAVGFAPWHLGLLVGLVALFAVLAVVSFDRRDLAV